MYTNHKLRNYRCKQVTVLDWEDHWSLPEYFLDSTSGFPYSLS